MANAEATPVKGKKGDGPVVVSYLLADGSTEKRVSEKTVGVRVADKSGNHTDFNVADVPSSLASLLIASAIAKKVDTQTRNGAKVDGGNVISIANDTFAKIKDGSIFARAERASKGEGGAKGRPFDFVLWTEVYTQYRIVRKQPATDEQVKLFDEKIRAQNPTERKEFFGKLMKDPVFEGVKKKVELQRIQAKIKKDGAGEVNAMDLF